MYIFLDSIRHVRLKRETDLDVAILIIVVKIYGNIHNDLRSRTIVATVLSSNKPNDR